MRRSWVVVGDERMAFSQAAMDILGFKCAHVITSLDELKRLTVAEAAVLETAELLFRIRVRLLGASL